ncbi:dual specificity mitogen-activated protein kinase kinase 1 [Paraphaeosphaeria sporulosa]
MNTLHPRTNVGTSPIPGRRNDLKDFLSGIERVQVPHNTMEYSDFMAFASVVQLFNCLAAALAYVHEKTTKHLAIKPRNVLVKRSCERTFGCQVYLADFGMSRSFSPLDHGQTESTVARTARCCAPKELANKPHGRAADVLSQDVSFSKCKQASVGNLWETWMMC